MCAYRPVAPFYPPSLLPSSGQAYPSFSSGSAVTLKRPFRHRRKDPSCDACRERKVKCDASGSNSCTECRTRNIPCRFTREHMRRLTSIKQVQDLERKLKNAKMEVSNLQAQMQKQRLAALDEGEWADAPTWSRETDVRQAGNKAVDFASVREQIIRRSHGLFSVPPAWRENVSDSLSGDKETTGIKNDDFKPVLPDRSFVQHLVRLYIKHVSNVAPYMDLTDFTNRARQLYDINGEDGDNGIPLQTSRSWMFMFFATLALTAYYIQDSTILEHYQKQEDRALPVGWDLACAAAHFSGPFTKRTSLNDVRGALTLGNYFRQLNELGAASVWLGVACKIGQNIGIQRYSPGFSQEDERARANAWWDIYLFDRILASQQGSEFTISVDSDLEIRPPESFGLAPSIASESAIRLTFQSKLYNWTMVHGKVIRLLRESNVFSDDEMDKLDERVQSLYTKATATSPDPSNPDATSTTTEWYMDTSIFIDNTKLRIYRHNLNPTYSYASRLAALKRCVNMAKETSSLLDAKLNKDPNSDEGEQYYQQLLRIVYPEHCVFLYNCTMYLIAAQLWMDTLPFILLLRFMSSKLPIVTSARRYLWGLLHLTHNKPPISISPPSSSPFRPGILPSTPSKSAGAGVGSAATGQGFTEHEELVLAYVAADMHQEGKAWESIWQKTDGLKPQAMESQESTASAITRGDAGSTSSVTEMDDIISEASDHRSSGIPGSTNGEEGPTPTPEVNVEVQCSSTDQVETKVETKVEEEEEWKEEDETWEAMIRYVHKRCAEQKAKDAERARLKELEESVMEEDEKGASASPEQVVISGRESSRDAERSAIQRRMSIANLL